MEEGGVVDKFWINMAHFIFYADFFIKDFYVAFTARVQFFQAASKEYKTSRWEAACQGCLVKPPRPQNNLRKKACYLSLYYDFR